MPYLGELAALFTSLCWSLSAIGWTKGGQLVGSQVVNRMRLLLAFLALALINWVSFGKPIPVDAGVERWLWFMLSGIIGFAFGDAFLFQAYQLIGPRLGMLLLSLSPVIGTAIAWIFLGEVLAPLQIAGMLVTLAGIGWVILLRDTNSIIKNEPQRMGQGILFGVLAALGQAVGLVFSRLGMAGDFSPFSGTLIRLIAALLVMWSLAIFQKQVGNTFHAVRSQPASIAWILFGTLFGPVIGVSASLLSVQYAQIGIASTLMALPPIFMLPVGYFIFKERFGWQAIIGTILATLGVALLFI